ncbi:hypothetical protein SAMN06273572_11138 [Monaibacterium marinum]|uniref:Sulfotransferase family protein n=1 Tax=Pontivivens marinum TaxID=1690039 RepID=A0A2C9CYC9_9RHOB|nr:hypothetical protein [Monaibacterium marinum]SOH95459.1 hypothetical protein SAMN06273572_11138 [Monaibacterium marinum]
MIVKNLYAELRSIIAGYDVPYRVMEGVASRIKGKRRDLMAFKDTDIVIDGFPRSANTYATAFFAIAQGKPVRIAHHLHESYQIRFAEKHRIPCVILVRDPLDAVISAMLRNPNLRAAVLLRSYIRLYAEVLRVHQNSVIAPFDLVVSDSNTMIARVNEVYGTDFQLLADEDHEKVVEEIKRRDRRAFGTTELDPRRIAAPSAEKFQAKFDLSTKIRTDHSALIEKATNLYDAVLALDAKRTAQ